MNLEKIKKAISSFGSKFGLSKDEFNFLVVLLILCFSALLIYHFRENEKETELKEAFNQIDNAFKKIELIEDSSSYKIVNFDSNIIKKVNINTANSNDLILLPGIGTETAKNIIEYRKTVGKFRSNLELTKISGISEKKLFKIIPFLTPDSLLLKPAF